MTTISAPSSTARPPLKFEDIPNELQVKIFGLTLPPRIIKLAYKQDRNGNTGIRGNLPPIPLQINKKWRDEFSKTYVKSFATAHVPALTWINHDLDTLYFDISYEPDYTNDPSGTVLDFASFINRADLRLVKSLAIHTVALNYCDDTFTNEILAYFGQVRTLNIIHADKPDPIIETNLTKRDAELTMAEVWDIDEKFHEMEKWIADVNNATMPPQAHPPFNPRPYHKPYKSELKKARTKMIEDKTVEDFPCSQINQKIMVSTTVENKLAEIEEELRDDPNFKTHRWRCPWDNWGGRMQMKDDDSEASTISYWDAKYQQ
ncbi:hypothetical protein BDZ45DRAFT_677635 [Acephala macrosclerotiorum]|nr:hypothetical protein BDZ45DRAFT_677635 [Acephala macrosclerotiorum]